MLDRRVIIVGGGLAGLAAAHRLAQVGFDLTILEARDRIGGRAWTVREPFAGGCHGELGAEFIDDDHQRIRAIAAELGVRTVRVLRHGFTLRYRSRDGTFTLGRAGAWQQLAAAMAPLTRDYERERGQPDGARVRELSAFSVRDWLRRQHAQSEVHAIADAMRGFFLADPDELSALPLAAELAQGGWPGGTAVHRVEGGTDQLVQALARAGSARLRLHHQVLAVHQSAGRVTCVVADERGVQREIEGAAAIVTLPAAVLADIEVTAMPDAQRHAIRALRYGCATKVVVQTSSDFFGTARARAFATDSDAGAFWDATEGQRAACHVISFLGGGSTSAPLARRIDDGAAALLSDLCWLRRGAASEPLAYAAWRWETDPRARGGYAYLDPGFDSAWLPLLRQPCGRVFLAGEHTSEDHQGYMEGAVESGERAAREVAAVL